ncbi:hypothetical protein ACOMHN_061273 [Nucella lapillus]
MAQFVREAESAESTATNSHESSRPLTVTRIVKAIANLSEKRGSMVSDIGKSLEGQYGFRSSNQELKQMLIRAVKAGRVKRAKTPNRFIVGIGAGSSSAFNCRRGRRRRRKCCRGGKAKGKKKGKRRRRRRGKKGKGRRGNAAEGGKGKGRRGRDEGGGGGGGRGRNRRRPVVTSFVHRKG